MVAFLYKISHSLLDVTTTVHATTQTLDFRSHLVAVSAMSCVLGEVNCLCITELQSSIKIKPRIKRKGHPKGSSSLWLSKKRKLRKTNGSTAKNLHVGENVMLGVVESTSHSKCHQNRGKQLKTQLAAAFKWVERCHSGLIIV